MTLALRWIEDENDLSSGGFLYFDAVQAYNQNHTGQVTKHPVDGGGNISDHFIKNNPSFSITAVFTGVGISTGTYLIEDLDRNRPFNDQGTPTEVVVTSDETNRFKRFFPESISQFLSDSQPTVDMDARRQDIIEQIKDMLVNLMSGVRYNDQTQQFDSNIQLVSLYEYEGSFIKRIKNNLVVTNLSFKEDLSTGYGLYVDMTLEQITFASLKKTTIPKDVTVSLTKKAQSNSSKGKQDSTVNGGDPPKDDVDPRRSTEQGGIVDFE